MPMEHEPNASGFPNADLNPSPYSPTCSYIDIVMGVKSSSQGSKWVGKVNAWLASVKNLGSCLGSLNLASIKEPILPIFLLVFIIDME